MSAADDVGVELGVAKLVFQHMEMAKKYSQENGERAMDSSSIYGVLRVKADLDFQTEFVKQRDKGHDE